MITLLYFVYLFDGTTGTTGATYMYGNNNGEFGMKLQLESRLVTGTFDINDYTDNVNDLTEPIELAQSINWESFFTTWWPSDAINLDITLGAYVSFEADATQDRVNLCVGLTDDKTNVCIYWIADTTTCVVDVDDNEVCCKTCNDGADVCDSDEYCLELFFFDNLCLPKGDYGDFCLYDDDACNSGYCGALMSCIDCPSVNLNTGCNNGEHCSIDGQCIDDKEYGETCLEGDECALGYCGGSLTCVDCPEMNLNTGCSDGQHCTSAGQCTADKAFGTLGCLHGDECTTGLCSFGKCVECTEINKNAECDEDQHCDFWGECIDDKTFLGTCTFDEQCQSDNCIEIFGITGFVCGF